MNPTGRLSRGRAQARWASIVASWLALSATSCSSSTPVEIVSMQVRPESRAALCQRVTVDFRVSEAARYSLAHGSRVVALGVTEGGPESVRFDAAALEPGSSDLRLVVVAEDDSRAIDVTAFTLDQDNTAPVARPRLMGTPGLGARLGLDGSLSNDADGETPTYEWRLLEPARGAVLEAPGAAQAALVLPEEPARVTVELTVTDPAGASDTAALVIRSEGLVPNAPPILEEPPPYHHVAVEPEEDVLIPIRASDPEGAPLETTFRQVAGPEVEPTLEEGDSGAGFRAPGGGAMLAFEASVDDGVDVVTSRVVVTVGAATPDGPPSPEVTGASSTRTHRPVRLSGAATTDPDTEDLWYEWTVARAPLGSLLGDDVLRPLGGVGATDIEITPDLPGEYVIRLRVADAVGFAPTSATHSFTATLEAHRIHSRGTAALACVGAEVAWVGPGGLGTAGLAGEIDSRVDVTGRAVAQDGAALWVDAPGPAVSRHTLASLEQTGQVPLPEGASRINAIVVDPYSSRQGDLYVGTNMGTGILDVSDRDCGEELGCWVGSPSTGYLHRPPSLAGHSSTDVAVLEVVVDDEGTTLVYLGNEFWLARLERRGEAYDFRHAVIDLFADGEPQRITAIALDGEALYCGAEGLGVVERIADRDCGYVAAAPRRCSPSGAEGSCDLEPTAPPPTAVDALAAHGDRLYAATPTGLAELDPGIARFTPFVAGGSPVEGEVTSMAACAGALYIGTEMGLWAVDLEAGG